MINTHVIRLKSRGMNGGFGLRLGLEKVFGLENKCNSMSSESCPAVCVCVCVRAIE